MSQYYTAAEAEQFVFLRVPKALITGNAYRNVSTDAKLLYGMLLDRMGLSKKNGFFDGLGRVFVYFTLDELTETLQCGHNKAVTLFSELEKTGLIERKRQGLGLPSKIYVKKFIQEEVQTSEKGKSGLPKSGTLDFPKPEVIYTEDSKNEKEKSIYPLSPAESAEVPEDYAKTLCNLREQIGYERLSEQYGVDRVDGIVQLMAEMATVQSSSVSMGREIYPTEVIRERFAQLGAEEIEYVLDCIDTQTQPIRNIRGYLLVSLFNAPATIDEYFQNRVAADMAKPPTKRENNPP